MKTIRRRILVALLPFTALALGLTAFGLDRAVRRDLTHALDARVLTLARDVGGALEMEIDGLVEFDLDPRTRAQFGDDGTAAYFSVRETTGKVIAQSAKGTRMSPMPSDTTATTYQTLPDPKNALRVCMVPVVEQSERDLEEVNAWLSAHPGKELPPLQKRTFWVEVAVPLSAVSKALAGFRARLAVGFGALLAALALVPMWLVSRALRPLAALSREAGALDVNNLEVRLTEEGVDAEVHDLVVALNRTLDRVTEAYERQQRFTADVAHELRTPLAALATRCEVTLRKPREAPELRAALETALRTTRRLTGLVENLLGLARYECEAVQRSESMDLADAARSAARLFQVPAEVKKVGLRVDLNGMIPTQGNPVLLQECLAIFIDNAVRLSPPGGQVRIHGGVQPCPWVAVEDDGPGISDQEIPKIFDRFYQVDPARGGSSNGAGKRQGFGLGLSIAREIARLHHAEIHVTSKIGAGSRFELRIGAATAAHSTP